MIRCTSSPSSQLKVPLQKLPIGDTTVTRKKDGATGNGQRPLILRHRIGEKRSDKPDKDLFMLILAGIVIARMIL